MPGPTGAPELPAASESRVTPGSATEPGSPAAPGSSGSTRASVTDDAAHRPATSARHSSVGSTGLDWKAFLLGVVCTLALVAVVARMLLPRIDSLETLIAWSDPAFWFLGGLVFLGAALLTRAESRNSGRNRRAPWLQLVIALVWFAMAVTAIP